MRSASDMARLRQQQAFGDPFQQQGLLGGLGGLGGLAGLGQIAQGQGAAPYQGREFEPSKPKAKPTIREELQEETDEWLKDTI